MLCPHWACKFLLGVFCGRIDLKSAWIAFPLTLSSVCMCVCALYCCVASTLTPITLLADGLTLLASGSHESVSNARNIDRLIFILFFASTSSLMLFHGWEIALKAAATQWPICLSSYMKAQK